MEWKRNTLEINFKSVRTSTIHCVPKTAINCPDKSASRCVQPPYKPSPPIVTPRSGLELLTTPHPEGRGVWGKAMIILVKNRVLTPPGPMVDAPTMRIPADVY